MAYKTQKTMPADLTVYGPGDRGKGLPPVIKVGKPKDGRTWFVGLEGEADDPIRNTGVRLMGSWTKEFDAWHQATKGWTLDKVAVLLTEYAKELGGTQEAMDILGRVIIIPQEDVMKATTKSTTKEAGREKPPTKAAKSLPSFGQPLPKAAAEVPPKKGAAKPPAAPKATAKKETAKPAAKAKAEKPAKAEKAPAAAKQDAKPFAGKVPPAVAGEKVGAYTQRLIIAGLSNEEVIGQLNRTHKDNNNTLSNVSWYRNKLRKDGKIPAAKK